MRHRTLSHGLLAGLFVFSGLAAGADLRKGVGLYEARKYREAAAELRTALEESPGSVAGRYYLGLALMELKEYDAAAEQLRLAGEQPPEEAPRSDQIKAGLAQVYTEQKRFDEAQGLIDEALKENDKSAEAHFALGKLRVHRKDYAGAVTALERAIGLDPGNAYAYYHAGIAYSNMRRPDRMVNVFQVFLKLAPDAPEADRVKSLLRSVR